MMMDYFLKAVEEYVEKCSVTLKQIRKDIEPVIKELADSYEDYEYMMDTVPRYCKTLSTKIRIVTLFLLYKCFYFFIAQHCPLKQGLYHSLLSLLLHIFMKMVH